MIRNTILGTLTIAFSLTTNVAISTVDAPLFQLNLSADEGNSTLKKLVIASECINYSCAKQLLKI